MTQAHAQQPQISGRDPTPETRQKLVLVTEIIAPYRIPVLNALARHAAIDLHVIFLAETDAAMRQWHIYKNEINFSYQVLPSWRWRMGKAGFLLNRGLPSALAAARPNVIICGGYNYVASWQALFWARRHAVEFVLWSESNRHDARAGLKFVESMKSWFLQRCDRFVVPGESSRDYLNDYLKNLHTAEKSIFTAPNAIDINLFASQAANVQSNPGAFREKLKLPPRFILFVGRLVPEKGVFDLLQAYSKLEPALRSEVGLVFAGEGAAKPSLLQQANRLNPGSVHFPGFAQREDLAAIYALADILILPTHSDPWGLVVNEAMSCSLPVIVSSVAGCAADLVDDGWNGYVIPPHDAEKLTIAIDRLLRQPDLRRTMGHHSWERIQNYSPEACAAGLAAAVARREAL